MAMEPNKIKTKAMCIIVRNGKEVMATIGRDAVKNEAFGRLLGGGVEFGELAVDALNREFMEELGTKLENVKFIRMIENVFVYNSKHGHEIVFLYKADLADKSLYKKENLVVLDQPHVKITWISLDDVKAGKMKLYPELDYSAVL